MKQSFHLNLEIIFLLLLVSFVLFAGCQPKSVTTDAGGWDSFVDEFIESYFIAHPDVAVDAGRHEFDGKLPDWSPAAFAREGERLRVQRKRALQFDPAALSENQRFERDYLVSRVNRDLFWLESAGWPYKNPQFYANSLDPNVYVSRAYAPTAERMRAYVAYARAIPNAAEQIRKNFRIPLSHAYIDIGKILFGGLASYYAKDVPGVFTSVVDAELQAEFQKANEAAVGAMKGLEQWLDQHRATTTESFSLGADLFSGMLRETEGVEVSIDLLEKMGREDLDRNLAALRKACQDYAPGKSIPECVARVESAKPEGGTLEVAHHQLNDLKAFVIARDLVTIPGTEEARVAEAPPYKRWNFAFIDIPGSYEKALPSVYYVAPPDPGWSKAERDAYIPGKAKLLFTSVHEVWPGHFLQFLHSNRCRSKFGRVFSASTAFTEGWAHYAEELVWEAGLNHGDPQTHIGQLLNALMRNARYLSAIGLHTKGMTLEESQRMFREVAYQDPVTARQQAARGAFDPAYLNYTLGKLMIRKLREDWTASRGGRNAWHEFHDTFLSYGKPPIPLIRAAMLGASAGPAF
ncbi:MAG: DUF885 domain-containing protein [Acidobacteria bacterium]|nr:DUF885 domain-containing protein [Acidobacteriota bacterium]